MPVHLLAGIQGCLRTCNKIMFYDPTVPENQMGRVYKHMVWSLKGSKTADQLGASVIPQTIQKLCDKEPDKSKHPKS